MSEEGWVTGKALKSVIALRAIEPGDQVKLDRNPEIIFDVVQVDNKAWDYDAAPLRLHKQGHDPDHYLWQYSVGSKVIAWKRPRKKGG